MKRFVLSRRKVYPGVYHFMNVDSDNKPKPGAAPIVEFSKGMTDLYKEAKIATDILNQRYGFSSNSVIQSDVGEENAISSNQ